MSSAVSDHSYAFSPSLSPSPSPRTAGAGAGATLTGPRSRRRLHSLITGRSFNIASAPTGPKRKRADNRAAGRRILRWNIAEHHASQYEIVRQWAWDRHGVLRPIEIIDLSTPTTATTTPEFINLITPSTASAAAIEVINLITPPTAATTTPEIINLVTPTTRASDAIEIINLVTPTTAGSGASFLTPSTYDRP